MNHDWNQLTALAHTGVWRSHDMVIPNIVWRMAYRVNPLNERVAQASAVATRLQTPKPVSLRDAGVAAPCGGSGMWHLPCHWVNPYPLKPNTMLSWFDRWRGVNKVTG